MCTLWCPPLVQLVLPDWIKYLSCDGALYCSVPWHPAQAGTEAHGTVGLEAPGLCGPGVGDLLKNVLFWLRGPSGFTRRAGKLQKPINIITLRQGKVSCEGGHTLEVTWDCESPF